MEINILEKKKYWRKREDYEMGDYLVEHLITLLYDLRRKIP